MSLPALPSPDSFLAVALVINRSRDGPRFVFHYPANVKLSQNTHDSSKGEDWDGEDGLDDDDGDVFADRGTRPSGLGNAGASMLNPAGLAQWNQDDHLVTESGTQVVPWEHVAGFPTTALEAILTPARAYHKTLFQVSLDPIYCVSYPIYAAEDGIWKRKKKKKPAKPKSKKDDDDNAGSRDISEPHAQNGDATTARAMDADQVDVRDMAAGAAGTGAGDGNADEGEDKVSSMRMFNLVFILNPKKHEVKELVDTMYAHIIKKVNKAYKYCQQRSDFVWKESKKILTLKDKAREDKRKMSSLWNEILATSSLAASMQEVYDAISQNRIAAIQLDTPVGMVTHSVQIPMPFHIPDLPVDDESAAKGLWLTTANSFHHDEHIDEPAYLDKNFALLLMEDEKKIISELQVDPDETAMHMIEFVKHSKPTMSFHQVAQQPNNILTLGQVRKYAQHFIYWRRAIAIPPLHARDVYVLSPNCDISRLPRATAEWARTFPWAPPLPDFLASLSAAPRAYKLFCPSKSHRPDYLRMLAWLMRGGWVTQLCTFAYVVVWPEILYEVEYNLEAEELAKAKAAQQAAIDKLADSGSLPKLDAPEVENLESSTATLRGPPTKDLEALSLADDNEDDESATTASSVSPSKTTYPFTSPFNFAPPSRSAPDSTPASPEPATSPQATFSPTQNSTSSLTLPTDTKSPSPTSHAERAAEAARLDRLADREARLLAERTSAHARKTPPTTTSHPSVNDAPHLRGMEAHVILDAKKPTGKESLYLSAIGRRLRESGRAMASEKQRDKERERERERDKGRERERERERGGKGVGSAKSRDEERVADAWPVFWKYFNGRSALERIALMEEMKRREVWGLLTGMSEFLVTVRHW